MAVSRLILYVRIKGGDVRRVPWNPQWWTKGVGESQAGTLWDGIKMKRRDTFTLVGTGCAMRGLGIGFPGYVI